MKVDGFPLAFLEQRFITPNKVAEVSLPSDAHDNRGCNTSLRWASTVRELSHRHESNLDQTIQMLWLKPIQDAQQNTRAPRPVCFTATFVIHTCDKSDPDSPRSTSFTAKSLGDTSFICSLEYLVVTVSDSSLHISTRFFQSRIRLAEVVSGKNVNLKSPLISVSNTCTIAIGISRYNGPKTPLYHPLRT